VIEQGCLEPRKPDRTVTGRRGCAGISR
jgi:hypothetical protein